MSKFLDFKPIFFLLHIQLESKCDLGSDSFRSTFSSCVSVSFFNLYHLALVKYVEII